MASSPQIQDQADADPALTLVATTGPWHTPYQGQTIITTWKIYLVHDSSLVTPLPSRPDVLTGVGAGQKSWLPVAQRWYAEQNRAAFCCFMVVCRQRETTSTGRSRPR